MELFGCNGGASKKIHSTTTESKVDHPNTTPPLKKRDVKIVFTYERGKSFKASQTLFLARV